MPAEEALRPAVQLQGRPLEALAAVLLGLVLDGEREAVDGSRVEAEPVAQRRHDLPGVLPEVLEEHDAEAVPQELAPGFVPLVVATSADPPERLVDDQAVRSGSMELLAHVEVGVEGHVLRDPDPALDEGEPGPATIRWRPQADD